MSLMKYIDTYLTQINKGFILMIVILAFINININNILDERNVAQRVSLSNVHLNTFYESIDFNVRAKTHNEGLITKEQKKTTQNIVSSISHVYSKPKVKTPNLTRRYANIKGQKQYPFALKFITDNKDFILSEANRLKLNAATLMGMLILENLKPSAGTMNVLASEYNNYGNLKHKGRSHGFSDSYYSFLCQCSLTGSAKAKDDHYVKGVLVNSDFYKFKSKWCGLKAFVGFISDRINTNHPNYAGNFNGIDYTDYKQFIYAIYQSGYATDKSYDTSVVRIIRTYNLDQILKQ